MYRRNNDFHILILENAAAATNAAIREERVRALIRALVDMFNSPTNQLLRSGSSLLLTYVRNRLLM